MNKIFAKVIGELNVCQGCPYINVCDAWDNEQQLDCPVVSDALDRAGDAIYEATIADSPAKSLARIIADYEDDEMLEFISEILIGTPMETAKRHLIESLALKMLDGNYSHGAYIGYSM